MQGLMDLPDYPFTAQRLDVRPGIAMSYLDEGPRDGEVVVMLHGNPSWSYYWRHLVLGLTDRYRVIVPDHVGMGLSDKPDDAAYRYTKQSRVDYVTTLLDTLGVDGPVTLAVHDWGGMIGMGWAMAHAAQVKRWIVLNTAMFTLPAAKPMPWQLSLGRDTKLGALAIRGFNAFSGIAATGSGGIGGSRPKDGDAAIGRSVFGHSRVRRGLSGSCLVGSACKGRLPAHRSRCLRPGGAKND